MHAALDALRGLGVPCTFEELVERWNHHETLEMVHRAERPPLLEPGRELRSLKSALLAAGVFGARADGRLNVPDVYRVAYELPLQGGVPSRKPA